MNYTLEADVPYTIVDKEHPITKGMTDFTIKDEAFFLMTWSKQPEIHVLATAVMANDAERQGTRRRSRAAALDLREEPAARLVGIAHSSGCRATTTRTSQKPEIQSMLLRGIAWAGKRPADALATERPQRGGGARPRARPASS